MDPECCGQRDPPPMEKQKRRTKTLGGPSFKESEGKGSEWPLADWRRPLQTEKPTLASCQTPPDQSDHRGRKTKFTIGKIVSGHF